MVSELRTAIEDQRSLINIVPGEGSVLGVWVYNGDIYSFRNKVGGASAGMYKSSSSGWSEVGLGTALNFDGTTTNGEPTPGSTGTPTTLTGATSSAQADLARYILSWIMGNWRVWINGLGKYNRDIPR